MTTKDELIKVKPLFTYIKCPNCNGYGTFSYGKIQCPSCKGNGVLKVEAEEVQNGK